MIKKLQVLIIFHDADGPSVIIHTQFVLCAMQCKYLFSHFFRHFQVKGSVDLLSHFTKLKCDSWTQFFYVILGYLGNPCRNNAEKLSPRIAIYFLKVQKYINATFDLEMTEKMRVSSILLFIKYVVATTTTLEQIHTTAKLPCDNSFTSIFFLAIALCAKQT